MHSCLGSLPVNAAVPELDQHHAFALAWFSGTAAFAFMGSAPIQVSSFRLACTYSCVIIAE
jgi:hypothetical protein